MPHHSAAPSSPTAPSDNCRPAGHRKSQFMQTTRVLLCPRSSSCLLLAACCQQLVLCKAWGTGGTSWPHLAPASGSQALPQEMACSCLQMSLAAPQGTGCPTGDTKRAFGSISFPQSAEPWEVTAVPLRVPGKPLSQLRHGRSPWCVAILTRP